MIESSFDQERALGVYGHIAPLSQDERTCREIFEESSLSLQKYMEIYGFPRIFSNEV